MNKNFIYIHRNLIYLNYRKYFPKITWSQVVWFQQGVPRLAIKDKLSTGVRTRAWGCVQHFVFHFFCGERDESRDYLYFACPYTFTIWTRLCGNLLGTSITPDWSDTSNHLIHSSHCTMDSILKCFARTELTAS